MLTRLSEMFVRLLYGNRSFFLIQKFGWVNYQTSVGTIIDPSPFGDTILPKPQPSEKSPLALDVAVQNHYPEWRGIIIYLNSDFVCTCPRKGKLIKKPLEKRLDTHREKRGVSRYVLRIFSSSAYREFHYRHRKEAVNPVRNPQC